jgi:hypothetical protein
VSGTLIGRLVGEVRAQGVVPYAHIDDAFAGTRFRSIHSATPGAHPYWGTGKQLTSIVVFASLTDHHAPLLSWKI